MVRLSRKRYEKLNSHYFPLIIIITDYQFDKADEREMILFGFKVIFIF